MESFEKVKKFYDAYWKAEKKKGAFSRFVWRANASDDDRCV
jgi:hypothetical protein